MIECVGLVCVCLSRAQGYWGCPLGVSTHTVSKPIWACWQQEHDCPSLWPHAQCQLCSAGMEGWRPEKEILGQRGDKRSRRGSQRRDKREKREGVCRGGEWGGAVSLQNTNETENRVMKEQKSNSRIEICTWLAIGDKYSRVVLNRLIAE